MYTLMVPLSSVFQKSSRKTIPAAYFTVLFFRKRLDPNLHASAADHSLFLRHVVGHVQLDHARFTRAQHLQRVLDDLMLASAAADSAHNAAEGVDRHDGSRRHGR